MLTWLGLTAPDSQRETTNQPPDCSECHTCEQPNKTNPCLKPICARHGAMEGLQADLGPSTVVLDDLENLYVPVYFNHLAHAQMVRFSGGCETCHHFTPPSAEHPACKECHPTTIEHEDIAQPGLKGAYHRNCMSCHQDWDKDTACEVCHERKVEGQTAPVHVESHYQRLELIELIEFSTSAEEGPTVPFHHRNHSELYERDCSECHQEQSCTRCHVQGEQPHPMGEPADRNLHDTCFECHHEERCDDCHGRDPDDLFQHSDTGWALQGPHTGLNCRACHGERGAFMKLTPVCDTCHHGDWNPDLFDHAMTGATLDEVHGELECEDCHENGTGPQNSCEGCHDDGRTFSNITGFEG
jgi:hypothetical protein